MSGERDTIFAPATASGRAGIAVIRISGPSAGAILSALFGRLPQPRLAAFGAVCDPQSRETIDRALVLWFPAPASFTGEDVAELHIHGSHAVMQRMLDVLGRFDLCRLADPGEFARRAFENGKLDLTAVEGLADLINAETEAQRRQALRQSEGALGRLYESWRADILHASAVMEATLDFSDEEDVGDDLAAGIRRRVEDLVTSLAAHLADRHLGERLRDGYQVLIAGRPNVGKSTLMNALARRDVAIVTSEAGTTRDIIEVRLDIAGYPVLIMDTAGLRETTGMVEREGIRRTINRAADADLILWLDDAAAAEEDEIVLNAFRDEIGDTDLWRILSKADLASAKDDNANGIFDFAISARTEDGVAGLIERLQQTLSDSGGIGDAPLISRARHRREVERALTALRAFLAGRLDEPELRAEDLRQAAQALGRLTGRIDVEELLGHIFGEFCIGK